MKASILTLIIGLMVSSTAFSANADCPFRKMGKSTTRNDQSTNFYAVMMKKSSPTAPTAQVGSGKRTN